MPRGGRGQRAVGMTQRAEAPVGQLAPGARQRALPGVQGGARALPPERQRERERVRRSPHGEAQLRDDAVARAAAAQRPEEVGALAVRAAHDAPVGEHDRSGAQVVGGDAVAAHEAPEAAAEHETGDPDRRARADGHRHAVAHDEVAVDVEHVGAAADAGDRPVALERDRVDPRDVGDDPADRVGVAGERVTPAARGDRPAAPAREAHDLRHVAGRLAEGDRARRDVQARVVERLRVAPARVGRAQHGAAQAPAQLGDRRRRRGGDRRLAAEQAGRARGGDRGGAAHEQLTAGWWSGHGHTATEPERRRLRSPIPRRDPAAGTIRRWPSLPRTACPSAIDRG